MSVELRKGKLQKGEVRVIKIEGRRVTKRDGEGYEKGEGRRNRGVGNEMKKEAGGSFSTMHQTSTAPSLGILITCRHVGLSLPLPAGRSQGADVRCVWQGESEWT